MLSHVRLFATPWITARQASLSITNSQSSLRLTSIESVMPSSHLILCHPLLLLPPIPPSIRVFSNESTLHMRWPKYWSFSFSIPSNSFQRNPRADLLQNGLVGSPCSPRDSQESSPTSHFKSINSSVLSLLHSPALTSIHVQEAVIKTTPKKKKCKKAKQLSEEALQIAEKRRESRKGKIYPFECRVPKNSKERSESLPQ